MAAFRYCRTGFVRATQMASEKYTSGKDDRGIRRVGGVWPCPVVSSRIHSSRRVETTHHCNFIEARRQREHQQQPSAPAAIGKKDNQGLAPFVTPSGVHWRQHFAIIIAILLSSISSSLFVAHCCSGSGGASWPVVLVETAADVVRIAMRCATGAAGAVGRVVPREDPCNSNVCGRVGVVPMTMMMGETIERGCDGAAAGERHFASLGAWSITAS